MKRIILLCLLGSLAAMAAQSLPNRTDQARLIETLPLARIPAMHSQFFPCQVIKGTKVVVVQRKAHMSLKNFWSEVRVLEGECAGEVGWVGTAQLESSNYRP